MAGETYNLAILLSLKDAASGGLMSFSANSHRAVAQIKQDIDALEKSGREKTSAIAKDIGKKVSTVEKLGTQLTKVDSLKAGGLQNASKQSSLILKQINQESTALQTLSKDYQKAGNIKGAMAAEVAAKGLRDEAKAIENIGTKLKAVEKLRKSGTDAAKTEANQLEKEIKDEIQVLDRLASKLREVKGIKIDNLDVNIKSNGLKNQISAIEAYEDRYDRLKQKMARDAAIGGVGVAGLYTLNKGVGYAASKEDVVLNLKQAYDENANASTKSRAMQEADIRRIMALATELGNVLQGNTSDYANLFTAMNKAGIDADVTLGGAGRAAAYLANVTGALKNGTAPQQAEDLGSFGKMFDLKGDDYMKVVQLFSGLEDRFNISSGSLVEASKYFFSTAKTGMGLKGIDGAETTAQLFAFLKRYAGREGSEAGTSLDALLNQFIRHDDARKALKKDTGVDLQLFDQKGNFNGVENMFKEFEKLRKLSPEKRMESLNAIFGEQGSRIVSAMVDQGVAGWRSIATEAAKSVSVNDKINQQMQTYNAKWEALTGSLENLAADAFTPLLDDAKDIVDFIGKAVNLLQQFSSNNQDVMKVVGHIALIGSTSLAAYGGIKTLWTGYKLLSMASNIASGGPVSFLQSLTKNAETAGASIVSADKKFSGFHGKLQKISSSPITISLQMVAAGMTIDHLFSVINEIQERSKNFAEGNKSVTTQYDNYVGSRVYGYGKNKETDQTMDAMASQILETMKMGRALEFSLQPERAGVFENFWTSQRPYSSALSTKIGDNFGPSFSPQIAAQTWKNSAIATPLADPNIMARLLVKLEQDESLKLGGDQKALLKEALSLVASKSTVERASYMARPDLMPKNNGGNPQLFGQTLQNLRNPTLPSLLQNGFNNFNNPQAGGFSINNRFGVQSPSALPPDISKLPTNLFENINNSSATTQTSFNALTNQSTGLTQSFLELSQAANQQKANNDLINQQGVVIQTFGQTLLGLQQPVTQTGQNIDTLGDAANKTQRSLFSIISASNGVANSLNLVSNRMASWTPPTPQSPVMMSPAASTSSVSNPLGIGLPSMGIPSRAVGGVVERDGLAMIHAGNVILPAQVTKGLSGFSSLMSAVRNNTTRNSLTNFNSANGVSNYSNRQSSTYSFQNTISPVNPSVIPARAVGGIVERDGVAMVHAGNMITPANVTKGLSGFSSLMSLARNNSLTKMPDDGVGRIDRINPATRNFNVSGNGTSVTIHAPNNITINGANKSDQEIKAEFQQQLAMHSRDLEHRLTKVLQNRRERA